MDCTHIDLYDICVCVCERLFLCAHAHLLNKLFMICIFLSPHFGSFCFTSVQAHLGCC